MSSNQMFALAMTGEIAIGLTLVIVACKNPEAAAKTLIGFAYAGSAMVPHIVANSKCVNIAHM